MYKAVALAHFDTLFVCNCAVDDELGDHVVGDACARDTNENVSVGACVHRSGAQHVALKRFDHNGASCFGTNEVDLDRRLAVLVAEEGASGSCTSGESDGGSGDCEVLEHGSSFLSVAPS